MKDEDYENKYGTELKVAVLQARARPNCLLKGYDLCLAAHVQPPVSSLLAIIKSAGGNVSQILMNYLLLVSHSCLYKLLKGTTSNLPLVVLCLQEYLSILLKSFL